jgi:uncharacterized C2H2 Zn-finger protein
MNTSHQNRIHEHNFVMEQKILDKIKDEQCPHCHKSFSTKGYLTKHIKSVHNKIKNEQCSHCDNSFSLKTDLTRHIKSIHDKIKDERCPHCDKSFSIKSALTRHIKSVHNKIKDERCPHCDKSFSAKGELKQHIKSVHNKIKDKHCPNCQKFFSQNGHLKQHIKSVHDKIKNEQCSHCDKFFSSKQHLKQHIKSVHDKIKNEQCSYCDKFFSSTREVTKHVKRIHTRCNGCGLEGTSSIFDFTYCYACGCDKFERTPRQKRQDQVFQWLQPFLEEDERILQVLYDKADPSLDSSTKFRGDIRIITNHRTIIVEVDERQHDSEDYALCDKAKISNVLAQEVARRGSERMSVDERIEFRHKRIKLNEDARMNDIASSGDVTYIIFIRFNPDTWRDENGKLYTKKKQVPEERLTTLWDEIESWLDIEKTQEHLAECIYLYYNGPSRRTDFVPMDPEELKEKVLDDEDECIFTCTLD